MIKLSYTSLTNLHNGHEWLNKQMGIPVPDYPFLKDGKKAHRLIQDHVSGKKKHPYLKDIKVEFPIVEEKDFDEKCKFKMTVDDYEIIGFIDGIDEMNGRFLEIKTSSMPWSMTKFRDAMQRKVYALANSNYKESFIITGSKDPEAWKVYPPKIYGVPVTKKDRKEALEWILEGIAILEEGNFEGGLKDGKCTGCFWNMDRYPELANCSFR